MYIPANGVSWLVSQDLDPGKSDLYLRLENGHLIGISWWDTIPAPLPGSEEEIHLEVHTRNWLQRPSHLIRPVATPQCVECEFYPIVSDTPSPKCCTNGLHSIAPLRSRFGCLSWKVDG